VIPIAGTVNVQNTIVNESSGDLEKEDWFAIWAESMGEDVP
jgi:predicted oxidoreductase